LENTPLDDDSAVTFASCSYIFLKQIVALTPNGQIVARATTACTECNVCSNHCVHDLAMDQRLSHDAVQRAGLLKQQWSFCIREYPISHTVYDTDYPDWFCRGFPLYG